MLRKLIKYEWRSVARQLIPLYLGVLGLALVNHFIYQPLSVNHNTAADALGGVPAFAIGMAYFAVCVAMVVITCILIIQRFYKGLLSEEGYLMFTLPAKTWQLIAAKGLVASILTVIGAIVGVLSMFILAFRLSDWSTILKGFFTLPWIDWFKTYPLWPLYVVEGVVLALVCIWGAIGHVYAAIAIGHLFKKHRIAWAIGAYIGIDFVQSVLLMTSANIFGRIGLGDLLNAIAGNLKNYGLVHFALILEIAFFLVGAAIFFALTNWILSRKLNLE